MPCIEMLSGSPLCSSIVAPSFHHRSSNTMLLPLPGHPHLTYCTNIHPGESWAEVRANIEQYVVAVKALVASSRAFGIGLRLSAQAASTLSEPATLEEFRSFLSAHDLYVFTINGFPHGQFHGTRVK